MENVLESLEVERPCEDEKLSSATNFFTALDVPAEGAFCIESRGPAVKDLLLGTGGSLLAHVIIALTALLPFLQPPRDAKMPFFTVHLVDPGRIDRCAGAAGGPSGTGGGAHPVEYCLTEKPAGAGDVLETARAEEKAGRVVPPARERKKHSILPRANPQPGPARQMADLEQASAPGAGALPQTVMAAADARGERDSNGPGAAGPASIGGPSHGGGMHGGEFDAAAVDQAPRVLHKFDPVYPWRARHQGLGGKVLLKFLVGPDGHVSKPSVLEANPAGFFEKSALEAINRWRFKPGIHRGKAVATWVILPVQFKLTGEEDN